MVENNDATPAWSKQRKKTCSPPRSPTAALACQPLPTLPFILGSGWGTQILRLNAFARPSEIARDQFDSWRGGCGVRHTSMCNCITIWPTNELDKPECVSNACGTTANDINNNVNSHRRWPTLGPLWRRAMCSCSRFVFRLFGRLCSTNSLSHSNTPQTERQTRLPLR